MNLDENDQAQIVTTYVAEFTNAASRRGFCPLVIARQLLCGAITFAMLTMDRESLAAVLRESADFVERRSGGGKSEVIN